MNIKNQNCTISVIIPTRNGEATLGEFFAALKRQHRQPEEILVVDSSSDDQTVAICKSAGAEVTSIAKEKFDHGGTRAELARKARGEILLFFTQDAILASRDALELLVAPLLQHRTVACSYGRQLPGANATPVAGHLRLFNYPPESVVRGFADRNQYGLKTIFISNSFAAYRRQCLAEVGYFKNGLIFGEDTCTLGKLLAAGHKVAYVAEAAVYHSHNYAIAEEFRRSFDIGVLHTREKWLLDTFGGAEGVGTQYVRSLFSMILRDKHYYLLPDCLLRTAFKMIGYKLGRSHKYIPAAWRSFFSMHRLWWQGQS
ncbi:MAG: glycosyltransferase [Desulforhopalus sp.]|nr:glycosyltransferase [Desulforhopalus sp.]